MADAVLFIHSTGTGPMMWAGLTAAIGDRRAVLPSNVGYPPNPPLARGTPFTIEEDVEKALAAVADEDMVHVVAHSYGGLVALHAVPALGPRLASMFLYEPVLFGALSREGDGDAAKEARTFASHPWFLTDDARGGREEWLELFIDYWNRPGAWKSMPAPMRAYALEVGWKMYQEVRQCFGDARTFEAWTLPARTTIAFGERSPAASRAMAQGLGREVRRIEIPKAGHMAPLTQPAPVASALAEHFSII